MKESFLFLADGFEEMEAICALDILRRAGIPVKTVSISSALQVEGAHGISVKADLIYDNTLFTNPNWLILPGGMPGATNLFDFAPLQGLLEAHNKKNGKIAAICAAPAVILAPLGILHNKKATCYPGFEKNIGDKFQDSKVVVSDNIITANGPGNATEWALAIVNKELGTEKARMVASDLLLYSDDYAGCQNFFG